MPVSGVTLTMPHSASDSKLGTAEQPSAPAADSARRRDKFKHSFPGQKNRNEL